MEDKSNDKDVARKSGLVYAAVFAIFVSVMGCLAVGYLLDRWFQTAPWLMVGGIVLGAVIGFYEFIRLISRLS